ncbi:MAG: hypothetical protein F6K61_20555 [Sphaerospermopsis sp. SIO1G1]|nr:hypothetical protein [Sphaerospermopsis sp. SIO1G1]
MFILAQPMMFESYRVTIRLNSLFQKGNLPGEAVVHFKCTTASQKSKVKSQNLRAFPVYFLPAQNIQFSTAASNPYPEEETEKKQKTVDKPKKISYIN